MCSPCTQLPLTTAAQEPPVGDDASATHVTDGLPAKPLLQFPWQLVPTSMDAQVEGKEPLGRDALGVPAQVAITVQQQTQGTRQAASSGFKPTTTVAEENAKT